MKKYIPFFLIISAYTLLCCGSQQEAASTSDRKPQAKEFVELLVGENYSKAIGMFDEKMKAALPEEKFSATWRSLIKQCGSFKRQAGVRTEKVQKYDVVFVTCEFEKSSLEAKVVFDSEGKIAGLFFVPPAQK